MRAVLPFLVLALAPCAALADFTGHVVKVSDGESLTVLVNKRQVRVRLEGLDAPERGQPFSRNSRQSLAAICAAKEAVVVDRGKDGNGRTIGGVTCAGVEASTEQVRRGMAWVLARYVPLGSALYELEAYARLRQLGLWADPQPVAPWDWHQVKQKSWSGR
ncbi:MAG TPA: thermonuclease family protein [Burkholderiales bacterium]